MNDDKVVHAFPGTELPENPITVEPRAAGVPLWCDHPAIRLDQHERSVHCAKCGATLDAFNFLLSNAMTLQQAWASHKSVTNMVREMNERVASLKKEEKRLRAQVKRLQEKAGDVLVVRGKTRL